jgi:hypothetical protein
MNKNLTGGFQHQEIMEENRVEMINAMKSMVIHLVQQACPEIQTSKQKVWEGSNVFAQKKRIEKTQDKQIYANSEQIIIPAYEQVTELLPCWSGSKQPDRKELRMKDLQQISWQKVIDVEQQKQAPKKDRCAHGCQLKVLPVILSSIAISSR